MKKNDVPGASYEVNNDKYPKRSNIVAVSILLLIFISGIIAIVMTGCSLSLQNINIDDVEASGHLDSIFPPSNSLYESKS